METPIKCVGVVRHISRRFRVESRGSGFGCRVFGSGFQLLPQVLLLVGLLF